MPTAENIILPLKNLINSTKTVDHVEKTTKLDNPLTQSLGAWYPHQVDEIAQKFQSGIPFDNVVIENFFSEDFAKAALADFPPLGGQWWHYYNPIEIKYATNKFEDNKVIKKVFDLFQSDEFVALMAKISGISNLEKDPHLHGAGLHYHTTGGKLDMHLDYSVHPILKKERRLNLILYLNDYWESQWGGALELWDDKFTQCVKSIPPLFNCAALFKTSDISYHGLPKPIKCPENTGRKSMAIYYVSDPRPDATPRLKAQFFPLPDQPIDDRLKQLYEIRRTRIITAEDLESIYPNWDVDGKGYW